MPPASTSHARARACRVTHRTLVGLRAGRDLVSIARRCYLPNLDIAHQLQPYGNRHAVAARYSLLVFVVSPVRARALSLSLSLPRCLTASLVGWLFVQRSFEEFQKPDLTEEQVCDMAQFLRSMCELARVLDNARILFFRFASPPVRR